VISASTAAMRAAPRSAISVDSRLPLVTLVKELAKRTSLSQIRIEKEGMVVHLARTGQAAK